VGPHYLSRIGDRSGPPLTFWALALCLSLFAVPSQADVVFGDDTGAWTNDGECDDPRFVGDGMAEILLDEDKYADATDCRVLYEAGYIRLRRGDSSTPGNVDFGADTGDWILDGECDDPRFIGDGMAEVLLDEDRLADATDCRLLYEAGRIRLRTEAELSERTSPVGKVVDLEPGVAVNGMLEQGDERLADGEYCDYFSFAGSVGSLAIIDLRAEAFDSYLIVRAPSGQQLDNDDFEGDSSRSLVSFPMREPGRYTVCVTSFRAQESGEYELSLMIRGAVPARRVPALTTDLEV
jgi:hypothetical protein